MDNLVVYVTAKATPENVNLKMNEIDVSNVLDGSTPIFGLGTAWYVPSTPWRHGSAYANFPAVDVANACRKAHRQCCICKFSQTRKAVNPVSDHGTRPPG